MSVVYCELCGYTHMADEVIKCIAPEGDVFESRMVCVLCIKNGTYADYLKSVREETLVAKKLNLNGRMMCPKCTNYTYDLAAKKCTSRACPMTESMIKPEHRIRQLLEFADYVCPFCHQLHRDLNNKICLNCKSKLSKKSMAKQYKNAVRRGMANPDVKAECTICGGKQTWPEMSYCHTCRMIYALDQGAMRGVIDGKVDKTQKMRLIKIYRKVDSSKAQFTFGIPLTKLEEVSGIKSITNDQPKEGDKDVVKLDSEEFDDLDWNEAEVTVLKAPVTIKVRYMDGDPDTFVVVEYLVDGFESEICPTIPDLIRKVESKQAKK